MWCWWPICYVGDMKFNLVPNSIEFSPSLNRCWGTYIGHQHHITPECDVGDWYLMLVPSSRCWWHALSPTSKSCHQHIWSPTSVTNIDVARKFRLEISDRKFNLIWEMKNSLTLGQIIQIYSATVNLLCKWKLVTQTT